LFEKKTVSNIYFIFANSMSCVKKMVVLDALRQNYLADRVKIVADLLVSLQNLLLFCIAFWLQTGDLILSSLK
jgi:hypothetical protein